MNIADFMGVVAGISWLGVLAIAATIIVRSTQRQSTRSLNTILIVVILAAVLLNVASAGLVFIEPTQRGVVITVFSGGVREEALQPGLNWIIPFADSVVPYNISKQTYTMSIAPSEGQVAGDDSIEARTSDGQVVFVDASVIFQVDPTQVVDLHIMWQSNYIDNLIRPLARGAIRDAVSQFGIEEVYGTERLALTTRISEELTTKLSENGLFMVDFVLRNIQFSDEYAASVEQKQIAEQLAQQAVFVVEQKKQEAEQARQVAEGLADATVIEAQGAAQALIVRAQAEAEARIIQAEAEAEALALIAEALANNPDMLIYEYITKLGPNIRVILLPADAPLIFPIPEAEEEIIIPPGQPGP